MKSSDNKSSTYFDFNKENNKEGPKFKVDSYIRISKYKRIFATGYVLNWSEEVLLLKKLKSTVAFQGHMLLVILTEKNMLEHFAKKHCKK